MVFDEPLRHARREVWLRRSDVSGLVGPHHHDSI